MQMPNNNRGRSPGRGRYCPVIVATRKLPVCDHDASHGRLLFLCSPSITLTGTMHRAYGQQGFHVECGQAPDRHLETVSLSSFVNSDKSIGD